MIGTSNIRYISSKYLAGRQYHIQKVTKYTVKDATEYIRNFEVEEPDLVIVQATCNDIETISQSAVAEELDEFMKPNAK